MTHPLTSQFNRCVVLVNPASTHYKRGLRYIEQLRDFFPADKLHLIETSEQDFNSPGQLINKLSDKLDEKTLLGLAAGDGTISLLINIILTSPHNA